MSDTANTLQNVGAGFAPARSHHPIPTNSNPSLSWHDVSTLQ